MTTTQELRAAVSGMLDGMRFNKEKLGRDCLGVCDRADWLSTALAEERQKSAALAIRLSAATQATEADRARDDVMGAFNDVFGEVERAAKSGYK